jgi:hypothetical protein
MYQVRSLRHVAWASPLLLLPLAMALPFGCATGGNGDGADDGGGGDEFVVPIDTGAKDVKGVDTSFPDTFEGVDTGKADGGGTDVHIIMTMDGGGDSSKPMDSGAKDTGVDTGPCTMITTTDAGGTPVSTCTAAPIGTTCGDRVSLTGFTPTKVPAATPDTTACTSTALTDIYNDCFATGGSATKCEADETTYASCYTCMVTDETATSYGPLIASKNGGLVFINQAGCIDLLEPCNSACAGAFQGATQCELAGCEGNCPSPLTSTTGTDFQDCVDTLIGCNPGGCDQFYGNYTTCGALLNGTDHPASVCVGTSSSTFEDLYNAIVPVFCGG